MKDKTLKKIIELAEGFEQLKGNIAFESCIRYKEQICIITQIEQWDLYPLLLRRAIEGWNKKHPIDADIVIDSAGIIWGKLDDTCGSISYDDYPKTEYLTPQEQAIEACLIELLEES